MDYVSTVCCLLAFLLYYNTLDAGFVYDDRRAILGNPDLLPKTPWHRLLENDFWGTPLSDSGSHGSYRPLCVLTFRLNYLLGGFQPWGYHLVNVLLHCLATVLLVRVARHILPKSKSNIGVAISGLLFATHPIHTETVAGVVGRADLAASNFYLMSFLAYVAHVKYRDSNCCANVHGRMRFDVKQMKKYHKFLFTVQCGGLATWKELDEIQYQKKFNYNQNQMMLCCWKNMLRLWIYLTLCILLALAAMLSKETGVTVLGICFIYDFVYSTSLKKKQWRSLFIVVTALILMLMVRLQTTITPQFSTADNPTAKESAFLTRLLTFSYLPVYNFWMMLCPNGLSFDWGMEAIPRITAISDRRNLVTLIFYAVGTRLIIKCMRVVRQYKNNTIKMKSLYENNSSLLSSSSTTSSSVRIREKTGDKSCPCSVCHVNFLDLHSLSCRNTNNNNSMNAYSTCVCSLSLKRATIHRNRKMLSSSCAILLSSAFLILPFLPATNILFYVGFVVAERVLYLPSAGLCLLIGLAGSKFWQYRQFRTTILMCLFVVLFAFSGRTLYRNKDWYNEESLYRSAIPINPPKAYGNLGSVLSSQGRNVEAESAFRKALQYRPNMADVHYNLGILLQATHRLDEAILSYQRAIHFRPSLALAYVNLGAALISAGRCQEAVAVLRQGSRLDGTGLKDRREHETAKVSALLQLGALYSDQGRLQRALATYREAAHSLPDHYPPQSVFNVLGETLARLQQDEEAERWYQAALTAQPDHVPAHITYGKLLAKNVSRSAEAEQWFRKAQRLAPKDPSVYHHYGEFLASRRRYKEAAGMYEKAAELRPADYELAVAAATAMRQAVRHQDAERWYRKAVALKPADARSHTNLGAILHLNGKYREAADSYREALRLQPNDVTTLTNLHKLHSVMT